MRTDMSPGFIATLITGFAFILTVVAFSILSLYSDATQKRSLILRLWGFFLMLVGLGMIAWHRLKS